MVIVSKRMAELFLSMPGHIQDIPILLDIVDINVSALSSFESFDGKNLFVGNITENL